jgi:hypothetical protein
MTKPKPEKPPLIDPLPPAPSGEELWRFLQQPDRTPSCPRQ